MSRRSVPPTPTRARARLASRTSQYGPDDPRTLDARRDFIAERLELHIKQVVDASPPLSVEQRCRLAALLNSPATEPRDGGVAA